MKRLVKVRRSIFAPPMGETQMLKQVGAMDAFRGGVDHANGVGDAGPATPPVVQPVKSNNNFTALFNLKVLKNYFTVNSGTYTQITGATLSANLKTQLPYFVWGHTDFHSGYKALIGQLPLPTSDWEYGAPFIYGKDASTIEIAIDSTVKATLQRGDMVIPFTSALPGTGTTTLALVVIRSSTVGYGTLLNALSSDIFAINKIRYVVASTGATDIAQYNNDILLFSQSLFGKLETDSYPPNSSRSPENQQSDIIDILLNQNIDKARALGGFMNFDVDSFDWNIYVSYFKKFRQGQNFPAG